MGVEKKLLEGMRFLDLKFPRDIKSADIMARPSVHTELIVPSNNAFQQGNNARVFPILLRKKRRTRGNSPGVIG